jgi:uncharacterized RDD family membrane protein YckC
VTEVVYPDAPPLAPSEGASEPPTDLPPPPPEERRRPVASMWTRAGELMVELVLIACTFGFGWVGWWIIAWADGQSPAKVVLHLHVVGSDGGVASFGRMAVREAVGKGIAGALALLALYYGQLWLVGVAALYAAVGVAFGATDARRRTLWDLMAGTVVLDGDPPPLLVAPLPEAVTPAEADTSLS